MNPRMRTFLLLGIIMLLLGVLYAPSDNNARWFQVVSNAAHAGVFGSVAILLILVIRSGDRVAHWVVRYQYPVAFGAALTLGAVTELLQIPIGRDSSWLDLFTDALGASIGLGLLATLDKRLSVSMRTALAAVTVITVAFVAQPVVVGISAYASKSAAFPAIADYRDSFNDYFLIPQAVTLQHLQLPERWSNEDDEKALLISFGEGRWPGIEYIELEPNWEGFRYLVLDITNPSDMPLELNVRVHDEAHNFESADRFNHEILLPSATRSVIRIPIEDMRNAPRNREISLSEVGGLILFGDGPNVTGRKLLVSGIWLEN